MSKRLFASIVAAALSTTAVADDTELFSTAATPLDARPNVLIILDNSSNWSATFGNALNNKGCDDPGDYGKKFCSEVSALYNVVVGALPSDINLGLMMFSDTGSNGGYIRYSMRQMTDTNKTAFGNMIRTLIRQGSGTDNAASNQPYAKAMFEAYKYFGGGITVPGSCNNKGLMAYAGAPSICQSNPTGFRDFTGNLLTPADASASATAAKRRNAAMNAVYALPGNALSASNDNTYDDPITDPCQRNYIIFISNGNPSTAGDSGADTLLSNIGGASALTPINPPNHASLADEFARFMFNTDVSSQPLQQNIVTYTVAVYDPQSYDATGKPVPSNSDSRNIALMQSMANKGGGKSYAVHAPSELEFALKAALDEIQSVDQAYAAVTLPVSVNVRGTNLNQVYLGVFRPDAQNDPRWLGNLKEYQLAFNAATNSIFLADRNGLPIESPSGFVVDNAVSFWTRDSGNFWSFETPDNTNDDTDTPDGSKVERGGVAQRIRVEYPNPDSGAERNIYTCTGSCSAGASLNNTPFKKANSDITPLKLGAVDVTERNAIIDWVRGMDNRNDENGNSSLTDVRASIHGDVIHSRPALINYNRTGDDRDVIGFYGSNDGVFRAVKGGTDDSDGYEKWAFIPEEFFGKLKRLRENSPANSLPPQNNNLKDYFVDGSIGVYTSDVNNDGVLEDGDGDKVWLFLSMRRGGRFIYALDVSDPDDPKFMWKKGCPLPILDTGCDAGYNELGQTWSEPKPRKIRAIADPVLIFGAGYDPFIEDQDPVITQVQGALDNIMGRGIFVVNARTGAVLWKAGPNASGAAHNLNVPAMRYAIPSDVAVLDRNGDTNFDRGYVGDTGGNVWRIDFGNPDPAQWEVNKLASVGFAEDNTTQSRRKFLYPPDVVYNSNSQGVFDAVIIGSGDREHPLQGLGDVEHPADNAVENRFYMFKDRDTGATFTGHGSGDSNEILADDLQDFTDNFAGGEALDPNKDGWVLRLGFSEKVVSNPLTLNGATYFNTHAPSFADSGSCTSLGQGRLYAVDYVDGKASFDRNKNGSFEATDRYYAGSAGNSLTGLPPAPVSAIVQIDGKYREVVCNGPHCELTKGSFGSRIRTFWHKQLD